MPERLADPHVEDFVWPHEVASLSDAQLLATARHSEELATLEASASTTTSTVPIVYDRADLGTGRVDDEVEMTGPALVGRTLAQHRALLLGAQMPHRDRDAFEAALLDRSAIR